MAERCATAEELEHYVLGMLDPQLVRGLEQHVTQCNECGARLHAEALLELRVREVVRGAPPAWQHWRGGVLPVLAGAALALLLVFLVHPRASPRARPSTLLPETAFVHVACLDS